MTCLDGLEWLVGGAERCCVRIGSHGDDVSGLGMLDWLGGGLLCEDLLTWWRCGRFGATVWLGASLPGRESGGADFHGTVLARCRPWP